MSRRFNYGLRRPLQTLVALTLAAAVAPPVYGEDSERFPDFELEDGERPTVALVLGGGGARGGAHLGVLEYLEAHRIPVDQVVGTSGGAILGGLYAAGWSPEEIRDWLGDMDWELALSDRAPRRDLSFRSKEDDARYLFDLEIGLGREGLRLPEGLINGRNLDFMLTRATMRTADVVDFDELPIPFRAVAVDMESGERVDLAEGRLARAIRASMSVPGVFAPVEIDDRLLADGGLSANLPVRTAREMDADIVIAVDVGARLHPRENLTDLFTITHQVTTLITHRSTTEEKAHLKSDDILITPRLGDLGSRDFPRTLEGASAGREAAELAETRLQALAVGEAEYEEWQEQQRRAARVSGRLSEIRFSGLESLSPERLKPLMEVQVGEPLDLEDLEGDLGRIYRLGEVERVDFALEEDGEDTILEVQIRERELGAHQFSLGLELFDDFSGSAHYDVRLGYTRPSLNDLGGEARLELQGGRTRAVRSEFYQPLRAEGDWFVATPISYQSSLFDLFTDGSRTAEYRARRGRFGVDIGLADDRQSEWRLGVWRGRTQSSVRIGDPFLNGEELDTGGVRLLYRYDSLDDAEWPRAGGWLEAESRQELGTLGSDRSDRMNRLHAGRLWEFGEDHLVVAGEWGEGSEALPLQDSFELGGPFSLAGLRAGELRGDRMAALRGAWFRQLGMADTPRGGRFFGGLGLESGGAWAHGAGTGLDGVETGLQAFLGADTPLGPVTGGVGYATTGNSNVYITLGRPFHRRGEDPAPW